MERPVGGNTVMLDSRFRGNDGAGSLTGASREQLAGAACLR